MLEIEIANGRWCYHPPSGMELVPPTGPYESFLRPRPVSTGAPSQGPCTQVHFSLAAPPTLSGLTRRFEASSTWWLGDSGQTRILVLDPPGPVDGPLWIAKGDAAMREVEVFCHPILLAPGRENRTLDRVVQYPLDQLLFIHRLALSKTILLHSAAVEFAGSALLFAGCSGGGKSTVAGLLSRQDAFTPFVDDRVALNVHAGKVTAFGTPWPGEGGLALNRAARAKALCFLEHAHTTRLRRLEPGEALPDALQVASIPWYEPELRDAGLRTLDELLTCLPCYRLSFNRNGDQLARVLEAQAWH